MSATNAKTRQRTHTARQRAINANLIGANQSDGNLSKETEHVRIAVAGDITKIPTRINASRCCLRLGQAFCIVCAGATLIYIYMSRPFVGDVLRTGL